MIFLIILCDDNIMSEVCVVVCKTLANFDGLRSERPKDCVVLCGDIDSLCDYAEKFAIEAEEQYKVEEILTTYGHEGGTYEMQILEEWEVYVKFFDLPYINLCTRPYIYKRHILTDEEKEKGWVDEFKPQVFFDKTRFKKDVEGKLKRFKPLIFAKEEYIRNEMYHGFSAGRPDVDVHIKANEITEIAEI